MRGQAMPTRHMNPAAAAVLDLNNLAMIGYRVVRVRHRIQAI